MIIIVTDDPDDARRVRRALALLERSMRLNGGRLPTSLLDGPVVCAGADWGGLGRTPLGEPSDPDEAAGMPPLLLDAVESARALRCSTKTVSRLIAQGELPSVQLGRRRLVRPADLQRYVDRLAARTQAAG